MTGQYPPRHRLYTPLGLSTGPVASMRLLTPHVRLQGPGLFISPPFFSPCFFPPLPSLSFWGGKRRRGAVSGHVTEPVHSFSAVRTAARSCVCVCVWQLTHQNSRCGPTNTSSGRHKTKRTSITIFKQSLNNLSQRLRSTPRLRRPGRSSVGPTRSIPR